MKSPYLKYSSKYKHILKPISVLHHYPSSMATLWFHHRQVWSKVLVHAGIHWPKASINCWVILRQRFHLCHIPHQTTSVTLWKGERSNGKLHNVPQSVVTACLALTSSTFPVKAWFSKRFCTFLSARYFKVKFSWTLEKCFKCIERVAEELSHRKVLNLPGEPVSEKISTLFCHAKSTAPAISNVTFPPTRSELRQEKGKQEKHAACVSNTWKREREGEKEREGGRQKQGQKTWSEGEKEENAYIVASLPLL